jgi:hypothetical protein
MIHHRFDVDFGLFRLDQVDFNAVGLVLLYMSVFFAITSAGEYVKLFADAVENKERRLSETDASPLE